MSTQPPLRNQSLELLLERITGLAAMATKGDVQSIMAVVARCTIEVADTLNATTSTIDKAVDRVTAVSEATVDQISKVSGEVTGAVKQIQATAQEIHDFNDSTTDLTNEVIRLNRRLFWATVVIAVATGIGAIAAIGALFKHSQKNAMQPVESRLASRRCFPKLKAKEWWLFGRASFERKRT